MALGRKSLFATAIGAVAALSLWALWRPASSDGRDARGEPATRSWSTSQTASTRNAIPKSAFIDDGAPVALAASPIPDGACLCRIKAVYDDGAPLALATILVESAADEDPRNKLWNAIDFSLRSTTLDRDGIGHVVAPGEGPAAVSIGLSAPLRHPRYSGVAHLRCDETTSIVIPARAFTLTLVDESGRPADDLWVRAWDEGSTKGEATAVSDREGRVVFRGFQGNRFTFRPDARDFEGEPEFMFVGASDGATIDASGFDVESAEGTDSARAIIRRFPRITGRWVAPVDFPTSALKTEAFVEVQGFHEPVRIDVVDEGDGRFRAVLRRDGAQFALDAETTRVVVEAYASDDAPVASAWRAGTTVGDVAFGDVPVTKSIPVMTIKCLGDGGEVVRGAAFDWIDENGVVADADGAPSPSDPDLFHVVVPVKAKHLLVQAGEFSPTYVAKPSSFDALVVVQLERCARLDLTIENAGERALWCRLVAAREEDRVGAAFDMGNRIGSGRAELRSPRLRRPMTLVVAEGLGGISEEVGRHQEILGVEVAPFEAGEIRAMTLALPPPRRGDLFGRVRCADGTPVADATVAINVASRRYASRTPTNFGEQRTVGEDGAFGFANLPHGRVSARCARGLRSFSIAFDFDAATHELDMVLPALWIAKVEIVGWETLEPSESPRVSAHASPSGASETLESRLRNGGAVATYEVEAPVGESVRFVSSRGGGRFEAECVEGGPPARIDIGAFGTLAITPSRIPASKTDDVEIQRAAQDGARRAYRSLRVEHSPTPRRVETKLEPGAFVLSRKDRPPIPFSIRPGETTCVDLAP